MKLFTWLKWWFWETRRCEHNRGPGVLVDLGRRKAWHCTKCGKCLELL